MQTVLPAYGDRPQRVLHCAVVDRHVRRVGLIDRGVSDRRDGPGGCRDGSNWVSVSEGCVATSNRIAKISRPLRVISSPVTDRLAALTHSGPA
jgi:hypothetical protein